MKKKVITKQKAVETAKKHSRHDLKIYGVYGEMPKGCGFYNAPDNCWYIKCSLDDGFIGLRSSTIICVDKVTGKVKAVGSAHNEG